MEKVLGPATLLIVAEALQGMPCEMALLLSLPLPLTPELPMPLVLVLLLLGSLLTAGGILLAAGILPSPAPGSLLAMGRAVARGKFAAIEMMPVVMFGRRLLEFSFAVCLLVLLLMVPLGHCFH